MTTHKWQRKTAQQLKAKAEQGKKFANQRLPKGVRKFFLNPCWMSEYENAPNERIRQWHFWSYEHSFWAFYGNSTSYSKRKEQRATRKAKALEAEFTKRDWQYLIDHTPNITAKIHYARWMKQAPD